MTYIGAARRIGFATGGADRINHVLALLLRDPGDVLADGGVAIAPGLVAERIPKVDALVAVGARGGATSR